MKITSSAFLEGENIPPKYTCDGENVNPPLNIANVPKEARSLALICDDPDAPSGDWVHWVVWNIDPNTNNIPDNSAIGSAVEGKTSFGENEYGGPCPPSGRHRYFFKLFALNTIIDLEKSAGKKELENAMQEHVLSEATLIGLYTLLKHE